MGEIIENLEVISKALEQEPKKGWNNHQIACMLADLFGDTCACNYNDIDEWLSELCDFKDTCCPNPVGVACWEQFLKYSQLRYTECGYEVRDKGALQEPSGDLISRQAVLDIVDSYSVSQSNVEDVTQDIISDIVALPSVKQEPKTDVLDKIRAEIEKKHARAKQMSSVLQMNAYTDCLQIIDKYKAESEG